MNTCLFCRIIAGEIPARRVYEDDNALAFSDINPQAPVHLLVIPKKHFESVHDIPDGSADILCTLMRAVNKTILQEGLDKKGYRLVVNSGEISGQAVPHIHVHILSGRALSWPPG